MNPLAYELANEIFMSTSFVTHLIVEGSSDFAVLRQLVKEPADINVLPANGSPILLDCKTVVETTQKNSPQYSKHKVHFFIDRDYRLLLKTVEVSDTLTTTDLRDLECQMVSSQAFEVVCREVICSKRMIVEKSSIEIFRNQIVNSAAVIGAMRYVSAIGKSSIDFKDLNPKKFFDGKTLRLNMDKLAAHLAGKNQGTQITTTRVTQDIECSKRESYFSSPYLLCSGHDIVLLMSEALNAYWKPKSYCASLDHPSLEAMLRIAYKDEFRSTECYKKIFKWVTKITGKPSTLVAPI